MALEVYQLHIIHFLNPAYSLLEILAVDVKAKTTHHSVANLIVHTDTDSQQLILVACCHHLHELQFLTVVYVYCATLADEFFCHLLIFYRSVPDYAFRFTTHAASYLQLHFRYHLCITANLIHHLAQLRCVVGFVRIGYVEVRVHLLESSLQFAEVLRKLLTI